MSKKVNILGTTYKIETHKISEDNYLERNNWAGYCNEEIKEIIIADMSEEKYFPCMNDAEKESYRRKTLRHECIHAYLNESGLSASADVPNCGWAKHEEMVDWFAIQSPKIFRTFRELGILEEDI